MSRHIQFESGVSLTGSNADFGRRSLLAARAGRARPVATDCEKARHGSCARLVRSRSLDRRALDAAADDLWQSNVVIGSCLWRARRADGRCSSIADPRLLGNIGRTIDVDHPSLQKQGDDGAVMAADRGT